MGLPAGVNIGTHRVLDSACDWVQLKRARRPSAEAPDWFLTLLFALFLPIAQCV